MGVLLIVLALCALAMQPELRARIAQAGREGLAAVQAFAQTAGDDSAQAELTLPEMKVWALQLGVFDSGESAAQEQRRLAAEGVPCVVWQRERMRLICGVALSRDGLDVQAARYGLVGDRRHDEHEDEDRRHAFERRHEKRAEQARLGCGGREKCGEKDAEHEAGQNLLDERSL